MRVRRNWSMLHIAAGFGQVLVCQMLLEQGLAVDLTDEVYETPLHSATMYNQLECIQLLIRSGADINQQNIKQDTPILVAL